MPKEKEEEEYTRTLCLEIDVPPKLSRAADQFTLAVDELHAIWIGAPPEVFEALALIINLSGEAVYGKAVEA